MVFFITGISTDVGKTIASAIITEALEADYWKPIQSGELENSDSKKVKELISNSTSTFFENAYAFKTPVSPHEAAAIEGVTIDIQAIKQPETNNHLVIEGAGGLLVPLNEQDTILDLIAPEYKVIVVSRHYLGSINHTLMTLEILKQNKKNIAGIIFSGTPNLATESIILSKSAVSCLGRIDQEPYFDKNVVREYADLFEDTLNNLKN